MSLHPEYVRGWQAAMKYQEEWRQLQWVERNNTSVGSGLLLSAMSVLTGLVWVVRLIRFGEWWPWSFLISVGFAVAATYAFRSGKRHSIEVERQRQEFKRRWP
jgi:cobalamin biosynthesis protein CobD/CbiB